jgi:hypothetical protein
MLYSKFWVLRKVAVGCGLVKKILLVLMVMEILSARQLPNLYLWKCTGCEIEAQRKRNVSLAVTPLSMFRVSLPHTPVPRRSRRPKNTIHTILAGLSRSHLTSRRVFRTCHTSGVREPGEPGYVAIYSKIHLPMTLRMQVSWYVLNMLRGVLVEAVID